MIELCLRPFLVLCSSICSLFILLTSEHCGKFSQDFIFPEKRHNGVHNNSDLEHRDKRSNQVIASVKARTHSAILIDQRREKENAEG